MPSTTPRRSADRPAGTAQPDWPAIARSLDGFGYAKTGPLLDGSACEDLMASYDRDIFRSRVIMQRHGFGQGEYKYFAAPLPDAVARLREGLYPPLAAIANAWVPALGLPTLFPDRLADLQALCARHGQRKPTPLLLRYQAGDYNCLHQDLYGEVVFPLQLTIALSRPGRDYEGGEFVLVEQRPRLQSRAEVVRIEQGEAVIFATRQRPVQGSRGTYRVNLRHGVSRVTRGLRFTLGIIFHDAA